MQDLNVRYRSILIIADDEQIRVCLRKVLEEGGIPDHRGPHNGEARLRQFRQISTDLASTDLFMRGRDGLDVTMVLRCDSPTVKIIVLTGGSGEWDYLDAAKLLGANRIIRKPVTVAELLQVVQQELLTSRAV